MNGTASADQNSIEPNFEEIKTELIINPKAGARIP